MGFYQTFSVLLAVISIVDCIIHLVEGSHDSPDNIVIPDDPQPVAHLFGLMALRLVFSLFHSMAIPVASRFSRFAPSKPFVYFIQLFQSVTVLMISCVVIRFDRYVLSLVIHLLTVFVTGAAFLDHLFVQHLNSYRPTSDEKRSIRILGFIKKNLMALGTVASVILAFAVGILIRTNGIPWSDRNIMYLNFGGEIFLRILKCLVLPLIFSSLVFAIGNMDTQLSSRVAVRALCFYLSTTLVAIITGIILVILIKPGSKHKVDHRPDHEIHHRHLTTMDTVLDLLRNICPDNIFQACFQYFTTVLTPPNATVTTDMDQWKIGSTMESGTNILGVVSFAVIFGAMMGRVPERDAMVRFFKGLNEVIMEVTALMIRLTPLAVMFLILPQIIKVKDLEILVGAVGFYSATVLVGLVLHAILTLPLIYWMVTRRNPYALLRGISPALITAFGTSSSSATMPVTFQCLEGVCQLDPRVVRFCIPIGATMNMDGTALYEAVAAIFIAQYRSIELSFVQLIIVSVTATAASIGAAGIPQAGLITMVIVLNSVGLDASDAVLIIVVDWFLDRFRTVTNVIGDSLGCALVNHLSRDDMDGLNQSPTEYFNNQ